MLRQCNKHFAWHQLFYSGTQKREAALLLQDREGSGAASEILTTGNRTKVYDLSVVRLADPHHAQLAFINVTDSTKTVYTACSAQDSIMQRSSDSGEAQDSDSGEAQDSEAEDSGEAAGASPTCSPDTALTVNVSSETKWVSLQPGLAYPEVEGIRVEVKGQVLSQGGDVSADQIADTSGRTNSSRYTHSRVLFCQHSLFVKVVYAQRKLDHPHTNVKSPRMLLSFVFASHHDC